MPSVALKMSAKPSRTDSSEATSSSTRLMSTPAAVAIASNLPALSRLRTVPKTTCPCAAR